MLRHNKLQTKKNIYLILEIAFSSTPFAVHKYYEYDYKFTVDRTPLPLLRLMFTFIPFMSFIYKFTFNVTLNKTLRIRKGEIQNPIYNIHTEGTT